MHEARYVCFDIRKNSRQKSTTAESPIPIDIRDTVSRPTQTTPMFNADKNLANGKKKKVGKSVQL